MIFGEIKKGDKLVLRVTKSDFKGKTYIDCRQHFLNAEGNWIPMKKGIAIDAVHLSEYITMLEKAEKELASKP